MHRIQPQLTNCGANRISRSGGSGTCTTEVGVGCDVKIPEVEDPECTPLQKISKNQEF